MLLLTIVSQLPIMSLLLLHTHFPLLGNLHVLEFEPE